MNTLFQLDNIYTDKGNSNTYYDIYTRIYENRRYAKNVMEIGILEGGSLKLWLEYFTFAVVYGIDSDSECVHWHLPDPFTGRVMIKFANAYDRLTAESYCDKKFDIIIDDRSHTLEHQKLFIHFYFDVLKEDVVMIIEDIQNIQCVMFYTHVYLKNIVNNFQFTIYAVESVDLMIFFLLSIKNQKL